MVVARSGKTPLARAERLIQKKDARARRRTVLTLVGLLTLASLVGGGALLAYVDQRDASVAALSDDVLETPTSPSAPAPEIVSTPASARISTEPSGGDEAPSDAELEADEARQAAQAEAQAEIERARIAAEAEAARQEAQRLLADAKAEAAAAREAAEAVAAAKEPECVAELRGAVSLMRFLFAPGRTALTTEQSESARDLARKVAACPPVRIEVKGHADASGTEAQNFRLSWERATNVVAAIEQAGLDATRFEVVGFGSRRAREEGDTDEARTLNRRVEFRMRLEQ